jgi:hypothetical protein
VTIVAVICALATATCVGYYLGRRAGSKPSTWKQRTSRIALGKQAMSLLVLITARRVRQRFGLRTVGPVEFLRAGMAWMRP